MTPNDQTDDKPRRSKIKDMRNVPIDSAYTANLPTPASWHHRQSVEERGYTREAAAACNCIRSKLEEYQKRVKREQDKPSKTKRK